MRASLPPLSDRMWRSPCHSRAHWTRQSCRGVGCVAVAGRQEGHVHTGAASICGGSGEPSRQCACHQLEHRSHWKRRGPVCWCPAPSPQWRHGARTSSSSSSVSCTWCRTSIEEVWKPARRCFRTSRFGRISGAQWTINCRSRRLWRCRFRPRWGCDPSVRV